MTGLYDDLATPAPQAAPPPSTGLYDDLAPPAPKAPAQRPPATLADRVQAAESGVFKGAAYLGGMIPDVFTNLADLGIVGYDTARHAITGEPLYELPQPWRPNVTGRALATEMNKAPNWTPTEPERPDDPVSRYLHVAGAAGAGAAGGGGSALDVLTSMPPALASQYIAERHPFHNEAANNALEAATGLLTTAAIPRGRTPIENQATDAVRAGQEEGLVFPTATTNPTAGNRLLSAVAGKTSLNQHMSVENQPELNNLGRQALRLPIDPDGAPISDLEMRTATGMAKQGYDAMRAAGTVSVPHNWQQILDAAAAKQNGAAKLDPSLADPALDTTIANLRNLQHFDASNGIDTISMLRDKASEAFRAGKGQTGNTYKALAKGLEDAIGQAPNVPPGILQRYQDSRSLFAAIDDVEENRNAATGNLLGQRLAAKAKADEYLGPPGSPLDVAGRAAAQAPKAFAEPTSTAGGNHLGLWGTVLAAMELGSHVPSHSLEGSAGAALLPLAYQGARMGARAYTMGPGQAYAVPSRLNPISTGRLVSALIGNPALTSQ